ncbi:MAG: GcrA family cell cycle regulator, partial [Rhodovarius sp.]|nr:GcrA family cell cycle regulator [Rhodovarius sp.]
SPPRPAPARRQTLPPLRAALREPVEVLQPAAPLAPAAPTAARPATPAPQPTIFRAVPKSCCWPIGEPGTREFRFCTAEALPGKPYCAEHAAIAYVKIKDKREDAA